MRDWDYGFATGKIASLEKKIAPPQFLESLLELPLEMAFQRVREGFFLPWEYKNNDAFLESIFVKEEMILKETCLILLKDSYLRSIFEDIEKPDNLLEKAEKSIFFQEFLRLYFNVLNTIIFLRIRTYNLKEEFYDYKNKEILLRRLEREDFIALGELTKQFYFEAKDIIVSKRNYLLEFLKEKYFIKFFEIKKVNLLSPNLVFWYYFAKKLNLKISNFLILGKFYDLNKTILKRVIEYA